MKVTVLDDYQRAFDATPAIRRLRERVEVEILTERLGSEAATIVALKDSPVVIPVRERNKFTAIPEISIK